MSDKNEALRLADALAVRVVPRWVHSTGQTPKQSGYAPDAECVQAAALLRRQHAENERLRAERDALRADADRYRWLRECAKATGEHWGGRWSLVIEGPAPEENAPPASIDAAIDAAAARGVK